MRGSRILRELIPPDWPHYGISCLTRFRSLLDFVVFLTILPVRIERTLGRAEHLVRQIGFGVGG